MKPCLPLRAILLAAAMLVSPAWAQTVYKCGNVYSQQPCPDAVEVDAGDARTPAQKAQTEAAAQQAAKAAAKLEKERLALEKTQAAKPPNKTSASKQAAKAESADGANKAGAKKKKKQPEYFTASVVPEKKARKADKKSVDKTPSAEADKTDKAVKP